MGLWPLYVFHIGGGIIGLLSGTVAMIYRKGSRGHVVAGKVFVGSMLTMAVAAICLAVIKHQPSNIGGGVLAFYLILTAWLTVRRKDGGTSVYNWVVVLIPVALGVLTWMNGMKVLRSGASSQDGVPVGMNFFMGTVMLLAAAGDVRMLVRSGVFGGKRIVRHLWRMCFGLFIATGSFFLGQQQVFPASWRGAPVWFVPALLPLVMLIYWVLRVWITKEYKRADSRPRMQAQPLGAGAR
ncbi:MAG TPA: hypothetical protein VGF20_08225 [Candidatus Acidoferrum sp.]|jgi:uncharacterized membrane protein